MFFVAAQHPYICCTFSQELRLGHRQLISSALTVLHSLHFSGLAEAGEWQAAPHALHTATLPAPHRFSDTQVRLTCWEALQVPG